jgi:N-glycosylase/DNA lyase
VHEYALAATLSSGQAFRWEEHNGVWEGVLGRRWVRLASAEGTVEVQTAEDVTDWRWLSDYLQLEVELERVLAEFPEDLPMQQALGACRGLRLLRQDPWECLASFILSSTKQIVQIQQIVRLLCQRFGEPIIVPLGVAPVWSFPSAARLARVSEAELRSCKMGFRAPYLLHTARRIDGGEIELAKLGSLTVLEARERLLELPGVGRKIADCVLLFAYGFQDAFPVDVWVAKALQELYFPRRRVKKKRLEEFSRTHFGRYAGFAQQYLFHYMRTRRFAEKGF